MIHDSLYRISTFPLVAAAFDGLLHTGKLTAFAQWHDLEAEILSRVAESESQIGIRCADKNPSIRMSGFEGMTQVVERAGKINKIDGIGTFLYNYA